MKHAHELCLQGLQYDCTLAHIYINDISFHQLIVMTTKVTLDVMVIIAPADPAYKRS